MDWDAPGRSRTVSVRFVEAFGAGEKIGARGERTIARLDAATRKHQRAGGEVDLVVAHHHEKLHAAVALAQQEDGRGETGR